MARLRVILAIATFASFYFEAHGKIVHKRSLADVKCIESGRFYRNPDRPDVKVWTTDECSKYYLCLEGEVFEFQCSKGLLFDVSRQLCDNLNNVHNCEMDSEHFVPKPQLDSASCANDTFLGCADGTCQPAEYFCDGAPDCVDESDESYCDEKNDPNAAGICNTTACHLPDCYCTMCGTEVPGRLDLDKVPQMILLTFDGPVNHENWDMFRNHLFTGEQRNPNDCEIKATFFVTHAYTNYKHVQKLWNDGHEIAINSITHRGPDEWWAKNATIEDWFDEMVGQANIVNKFASVRMEDFRGLRVPNLAVGGNRQFMMMKEFGFVYDATIIAPANDKPYWPYTLDFKVPHDCNAKHQICPSRSYPGLWEIPINPLHNNGVTCETFESCLNKLTAEEVYNMLVKTFKRHYLTNKAPFGIHLKSSWLKHHNYLAAFEKFLNELLRLPDVYFVTMRQLIDWMKQPTPINYVHKIPSWKCKLPYLEDWEYACDKPNTCKLSSAVFEHDKYMITCNDCPRSYPWIRNEFGFD